MVVGGPLLRVPTLYDVWPSGSTAPALDGMAAETHEGWTCAAIQSVTQELAGNLIHRGWLSAAHASRMNRTNTAATHWDGG